jgi:hypothetical protein
MTQAGRTRRRRADRWTRSEVLEQVAQAGADAEATARAVLRWADSCGLAVRGGQGLDDRSVTLYTDSGRGPGILSLYGAENGGCPRLEIRIRQLCSLPPYNDSTTRDRLRATLGALGIPRLADGKALTARPGIPLDQLTPDRLERLLALLNPALP